MLLRSANFVIFVCRVVFGAEPMPPPMNDDLEAACRTFGVGGLQRLSEMASPQWPLVYPPSVDCIRVLRAPSGYEILIHFDGVFEVRLMVVDDSRRLLQIESGYETSLLDSNGDTSINCPNDYLVGRSEISAARHLGFRKFSTGRTAFRLQRVVLVVFVVVMRPPLFECLAA